jgi:hypothetical protein
MTTQVIESTQAQKEIVSVEVIPGATFEESLFKITAQDGESVEIPLYAFRPTKTQLE